MTAAQCGLVGGVAVSPEEYIEQRVDDQISWYDRKSLTAQQWFKRLRGADIVCAAAIPVWPGLAASISQFRLLWASLARRWS
jgi:hypothetical protein